jgi:catechol 2,3-dioxygenase-like lactoylglutathione lyase family enzyme
MKGLHSRSRTSTSARFDLPNQLHHVVMRSHSAVTFIQFLTDVVGMEIQTQFRVPGDVLETTLGWPPSDGADVTMLGGGNAGLIEVLDVPEHLRDVAPEGLAALSFLTDDYNAVQDRAKTMASDVTVLFGDVPGVNLFFCTMGGVPIEFMGGYDADNVPATVASGDGH